LKTVYLPIKRFYSIVSPVTKQSLSARMKLWPNGDLSHPSYIRGKERNHSFTQFEVNQKISSNNIWQYFLNDHRMLLNSGCYRVYHADKKDTWFFEDYRPRRWRSPG